MRRPIAVSVFMALILASLAAPQNSGSQSADCNAPSQVQVMGNQNWASSNDVNCECVPFYMCNMTTGSIITDGSTTIDITSRVGCVKTVGSNRGCDSYMHICCMPPDQLEPGNMITPKPKTRRGCGQRNPDGVGYRITGNNNNEAQFGEFPWMVAILREETIGTNPEKLNVYQCGGALIHPQAVLTAAHCVNGMLPFQLKIRAGEWDTQMLEEILPHQDRDVEKIIVHENFIPSILFNDVAILILKTPVDLAANVDVVCLPRENEIFDGTRCIANGWGKDKFGAAGVYQVILKSIALPVIPHNICQTVLRRTRLGRFFKLHRSFICAGGEGGKDTCKGDGGGPLVCPLKSDPTRYAQVGIVAWGIGCGEDQVPGVYASVAALRHWIDVKMNNNGLDTSVYQNY